MTEKLLNKQLSLLDLTSNQSIALGVIIILGLFLRMGMIDMTESLIPLRNDSLEYYSYATNMKYFETYSMAMPQEFIDGNTEPTPDLNRPPGYSLFLYPFVDWPPTLDTLQQIRITQVVLDTITIFLSLLVFRFFLSNTMALGGALLVALSPHLIAMNYYLLSETLFTFFLMLFLYVTTIALTRGIPWIAFTGGVILGLSLLIKPTMNYYFIFLFALSVFQFRKNHLKLLGILFIGCVLVLLPWQIRNMTIGSPEQAESKALVSLQNGSYPDLTYNDNPETRGEPHRWDPNYENIQTYSDFFSDLSKKIADDPMRYLGWYIYGKPVMMLSWDIVGGWGDIYVYSVEYSPWSDRQPFVMVYTLMKLIHPFLMLLGLIGLACILVVNKANTNSYTEVRKNTLFLLAGSVLFYFFVLHIVATPLPRYMIPLRPIMYGLALYITGASWRWIQSRLLEKTPENTPVSE